MTPTRRDEILFPGVIGVIGVTASALGCGGGEAAPRAPSQAVVVICADDQEAVDGVCKASARPVTPKPAPLASSPRFERAPAEVAGNPASVSNSDLLGAWHGNDTNGWASYDLRHTRDGMFRQDITTLDTTARSPGVCHQQGAAWVEEGQLFMRYDVNDCNTAYVGQTSPDRITAFDGRTFTIEMGSYHIVYTRLR